MGRLAGKTAVVTGATAGIGKCIAERFVAEGANVVLAALRAGPGEEIARELGPRARFRSCDVTIEANVRETLAFAVAEFGRLDILVNNAGSPVPGSRIADVPSDVFDDAYRLLLRGPFYGIKHAALIMAAAGSGAIINMSSVAAFFGGCASSHLYAALKAANTQLARSASLELAERGVRVNSISPGGILTPMTTAGAEGEPLQRLTAAMAALTPLDQAGMPDDVAAAALYLASDEARFVTGIDLVVDGGWTAGWKFAEAEQRRAGIRAILAGT